MKKYLLFLAVLLIACAAYAQDDASRTIDQQDTIVFDLSQAWESGGYAYVPVYFLSDDSVDAVDFAISYNTVNLTFDTILNLDPNLSIVTNEVHSSDTVIIFTSYNQSLTQHLPYNTNLVKVRFALNPGDQICAEDFDSTAALLNGDACSVKIVDCTPNPNGIASEKNISSAANIYPNPAAANVTVEFSLTSKDNVSVSAYDVTGKRVYQTNPAEYSIGSHKVNLNLSGLENGVYFIRIDSENETKSARISVIR